MMKTTLDIPTDLYREAKAAAALDRIRMKDLVAEGIRLALDARGKNKRKPSPLEVLQQTRLKPLHQPGEVAKIMEMHRLARVDGWNHEDSP